MLLIYQSCDLDCRRQARGTCSRCKCSSPGRMRLMPAERRFDVCEVSVPVTSMKRSARPAIRWSYRISSVAASVCVPQSVQSQHIGRSKFEPLRSNRMMIRSSAGGSRSGGGGRTCRRQGTTLLWPCCAADAAAASCTRASSLVVQGAALGFKGAAREPAAASAGCGSLGGCGLDQPLLPAHIQTPAPHA